jgi:hypothetical protein
MPSFDDWLEALNRIFIKELQMGYTCFEDYDWYAEWDSEVTPRDAYEEWNLIAGPAAQ